MAKRPPKPPPKPVGGNVEGGATKPAPTDNNAGSLASRDSKKPLRGPKTEFEYGRMKVRIFHAQEGDLDELGRLSRDTTLLAAVSTGFGGFALDVSKDLFLSSGANAETIAFFAGVSTVCWAVAIFAGIGAASKWRDRDTQLKRIKSKVSFDADLKPEDRQH